MSRIHALLLQNLMTKALALVLAVLVWWFVELDITQFEVRPRVPIEVVLARKDLMVLQITDADGRPIEFVEVRLRGPRSALADVQGDLKCVHTIPADDIEPIRPGQRIPIALSPSDLKLLPPRVSAEISPSTVLVSLEQLRGGYVRIDTSNCIIGTRRDDLVYEVQGVRPAQVFIQAPDSLLRRYEKDGLPIRPIDVSQYTTTNEWAVSWPDAVRQKVQIGPNQQAIVTIRIEPKPEEFETTVPVCKLLPPVERHSFELRKPKEVKIKVRGPKKSIEQFKQQTSPPVQVYVDLAGYKVEPAQEGGIISDAPMGWVLRDPEAYPGLVVLGVPERAEEVFVRKKE